jgi:hypothetical protein
VRVLRGFGKPRILRESGRLKVADGPTFVVVCGPGFDQSVPTANATCRLGWCNGFEALGIPYLLLSVHDLARRLPEVPGALCWISGYDYRYLDARNLEALKRHKHMVWVDTWFHGEADFRHRNGLPRNQITDSIRRRVLSTSPDLLFTISPTRSFDFYALWQRDGQRLVSLPLACDATVYVAEGAAGGDEFDAVDLAFVGGYWPYKARQFDRYLKPYQTRLTVYGYTAWPYAGYCGPLAVHREPALYRQARLSPSINEPHVELMGTDLNERAFKVMGSGGLTITDVVPAYREWFTQDELLVPRSLAEFHDLVHTLWRDEGMASTFRERGRQAVLERHTYSHRAQQVLDLVGIHAQATCDSGVRGHE